MNIADIEKVANRKRVNAEAENLREKVNKETTNIIKLKVAQDTAYWDLKEKLHQLENNHERLQQNMVEVQMQHEAISGQYQDELRLRPETLNKLSSTREICDVLEEYSERLKASVSRCKADQVTLAEAYNKSGQVVRDIKDKQIQSEEKNLRHVNNLQEKVKLLHDHKEQMMQMFASSKEHLDSELSDARSKLATALSQKDELFVALNDLARKLDRSKHELEKKEENITSMQTDMKKWIIEFNNQTAEMKDLNSKQEKQVREYTEANESLKKALQNQEQFTKSICDQNAQLQEKISALEGEQILSSQKVTDLEKKLEDSVTQCGILMKDLDELNAKIEELENEINQKKMLLEQSFMEHKNLKDQIYALEEQKTEIVAELNRISQESDYKSIQNEELSTNIKELQTKISEMEIVLENNKIHNTIKITEINNTLESKVKLLEMKDKELDCKASTVNQLMSDLKTVTDARTKLENNVEKLKKEMEIERDITKEKETAWKKKVEQLEMTAKERENELSKQMSIILDMRNEKERLQERLKGVQITIDNIEKEVTGRSASQPDRHIADFDDNAVMLTPAPVYKAGKKIGIPPTKKNQKTLEFATPKEQVKQLDNLLFNLYSDSSMDNELTVDPAEINRHFDAMTRGERISPLSFKRRNTKDRNAPFPTGLNPSSDSPLSLSQLRAVKSKRTIFKSKRSDSKAKKTKPEE